MLVKGTVPNTVAAGAVVIFKNCAPYTNCISEIKNARVDDAQKVDVLMPMYNLIGYGDTYSKTSGSLCQYDRDEPALGDNGNIIEFPANENNSASFKFKQKITGENRKRWDEKC